MRVSKNFSASGCHSSAGEQVSGYLRFILKKKGELARMKLPLFIFACCLLDLLVVAKAAPQCKIKSDGLWTMKEYVFQYDSI